MAEEALDLEGEGMKAFLSGFWNGFKQTFLIIGFICSFAAAIFGLVTGAVWLLKTVGMVSGIIITAFLFMIVIGIIQGFWVLKHYNKLKRELNSLEETREYTDISSYNDEKARIKNKMARLLHGNYDGFCR